ncbi:MAG: helix-turn-helix domain-containing protein [Proteobacteria bacterium]|nr:helix-turn-helix domain-containing protein [Pseudomonadota bacterium]
MAINNQKQSVRRVAFAKPGATPSNPFKDTRRKVTPSELVPSANGGASFNFSERLRELRTRHGLSLEMLAQKTGLTKGFLSLVERGLKAPSISTLLKLSETYNVSVGDLLDERMSLDPPYSLVRRTEGKKYAKDGSLFGYRYEAIAFHKAQKKMEPFLVSPPMRMPQKFFQHAGDEMVYVLKGQVDIQLSDDQVMLFPGDCLYFDAATPHRSRSVGKERALTLVVVTPS